MKREYESKVVSATLTKMDMKDNIAELSFLATDGKTTFKEELDLLDTHNLFRFSMFLESFHVKNLDKARQHLNIFIKHKIKIGLVVDRNNLIIYSNMLEKDQLQEFKKHITLAKLVRTKKISKEMFDEMQDMSYEEIKAVIK
jgi:hypothetical protein